MRICNTKFGIYVNVLCIIRHSQEKARASSSLLSVRLEPARAFEEEARAGSARWARALARAGSARAQAYLRGLNYSRSVPAGFEDDFDQHGTDRDNECRPTNASHGRGYHTRPFAPTLVPSSRAKRHLRALQKIIDESPKSVTRRSEEKDAYLKELLYLN